MKTRNSVGLSSGLVCGCAWPFRVKHLPRATYRSQPEETFELGYGRAPSALATSSRWAGGLGRDQRGFRHGVRIVNQGNGSFQPAQHFTVGVFPRSVAVGDFNQDRRQDLAVANQESWSLSILIGNGDGTFQAAGLRGWQSSTASCGRRLQPRRPPRPGRGEPRCTERFGLPRQWRWHLSAPAGRYG